MEAANILIVEDDRSVAASLSQGLREAGYGVALASRAEEGFRKCSESPPDLMILDLGLPDIDGLQLLTLTRQYHKHLPVMIVSARDATEDRVKGLDLGANDYLVKPFAFPEVLARIRVQLRQEPPEIATEISIGDLHINFLTRCVQRAGSTITLTNREYELLELLVRNHGRVVSRRTIEKEIWSVSRATPLDNVVDVHVNRLRKKLNTAKLEPMVHTIRGLGFTLEAQRELQP